MGIPLSRAGQSQCTSVLPSPHKLVCPLHHAAGMPVPAVWTMENQPQPLAVAEQEWHSSPRSNAAGQKRSTEQQTASQVRLRVFKNTSALIIATETFSSGVKHAINTSACWRGDV